MLNAPRRLFVPVILAVVLAGLSAGRAADDSNNWQITSIRACRDHYGNLHPTLEAIGRYPVYSFFIPRPVWTVNGTVVESQPQYERGALVSFKLLRAGHLLKPGTRNIVKLSLPDQNTSKIFRYDETRPRRGECYEFF